MMMMMIRMMMMMIRMNKGITAHEVVDDGVEGAVEVGKPVRNKGQHVRCRRLKRQHFEISVGQIDRQTAL